MDKKCGFSIQLKNKTIGTCNKVDEPEKLFQVKEIRYKIYYM